MSVKQKIPKWLELADDESFIRTYQLNEVNILVLFVIMIIVGGIAVYYGLSKGQWDSVDYALLTIIPMITVLIALRDQNAVMSKGNKLYLTSKRIVVETNFKWKWIGKPDETMLIEIQRKIIDGVDSSFNPKWIGKLDEISLIEIQKKVIGGIVKVRFINPEAPVISAYSIFPAAMAKEIQAACASAKEHNVVENKLKGDAR